MHLTIKKLCFTSNYNHIHTQSILSVIQLKYKRIVTGSKDGSIHIFPIDNNNDVKHIIKTNAHKGWVRSLCELENNKLISTQPINK